MKSPFTPLGGYVPAASAQGETCSRLDWLVRAVSAPDIYVVAAGERDAARRAVRDINNMAGEILAEWVPDTGIRLTPRGRRLSVALHALREEQVKLLTRFGLPFADDLRLLERVAVRTSARNQFVARVVSLPAESRKRQQVLLDLANGARIAADITCASVEALRLAPGLQVLALVKASAMILMPRQGERKGWNYLQGQLGGNAGKMAESEQIVYLGAGLTAVALRGNALCLPGQPVVAAFPASAVLLGVFA